MAPRSIMPRVMSLARDHGAGRPEDMRRALLMGRGVEVKRASRVIWRMALRRVLRVERRTMRPRR